MKKKKEKTIQLIVARYDIKREFGILHAERLLRMGFQDNGGWELPPDSKYAYSKEHGIRLKSDKADSREAR